MIACRTDDASRMSPVARRRARVLADEGIHRRLLALDRPRADALGDDVQHHHLRPEPLRQVAADAHRQLGVRAAAHRDEDRGDVVEAALLDDGEVARRLADHRIDGRAEDRPRPGMLAGQRHLGGLRLGARRLRRRRRAAPAEDDEVGALLADRLDDAVGGLPSDAHHRPQLDALLVADVEDALEQASRGSRLGGALAQRDSLGHLHDAEHGDLGRVAHSRRRRRCARGRAPSAGSPTAAGSGTACAARGGHQEPS